MSKEKKHVLFQEVSIFFTTFLGVLVTCRMIKVLILGDGFV